MKTSVALAKVIVEKLIEKNKRLTCVESCTGGLLSAAIVRHSGVSSIFDGAIVSYSDEIKHKLLGVKKTTLESFGAVSKECVLEMLNGLLKIIDADFALAISGIAGPGGGSELKPVGTVIIGVKAKNGVTLIEEVHFKGDRNHVQNQAVFYALKLLVLSNKKLFLH